MSYYIAQHGRVLSWEGKMNEPPLDTSSLGFENLFEDKERAFYFRDKLREEHPRIFLKSIENNTPKDKMNKREIFSQEDFREAMRCGVAEHLGEFWKNLNLLKPRDYVDGFLKAASYGFSRAPSEKEIDEEQKEQRRLREQQRRQELITRGIELEEE